MRALPLFTVLVAASCASPDAWRRAQQADSADAYREFLARYPKAEEAEAAEERLQALDFEEAGRVQSVLGWKRFLEQHPEGPEARTAKARLEALRFNAASQRDTLEGWRLFLSDHPDGAHAEEARAKVAVAEARLVTESQDPLTLEGLARANAGSARGMEARARLDDQRFSLARDKGARALLAYLADFPEGTHRVEAQAALFELELEGLLFSGEWDVARAAYERSALKDQLPDFPGRLTAAEALRALEGARDVKVQRALAGHVLRPREELVAALGAADPLDRWQAAEELGEYASVRVLDPLLDAWRRGRNLRVRVRAFTSLQRLVHALPPRVAEHQLALRLEALRAQAATPELHLALATLLDLLGDMEEAAAEYQKAWQPEMPDPAILMRWISIRTERRQPFSAAVAARQLANWAKEAAASLELSGGPVLPVGVAREACAVAEAARVARDALKRARTERTDFPEDVLQFSAQAEESWRLAEARLKDAEVRLRGEAAGARSCADEPVAERLREGRKDRVAALQELARAKHPLAALAARHAAEADPEPAVRTAAAALSTR